ncbi:MAG: DUF1214 domain-containing protein [Steroidobacteraceae bacterium]
MNSRSGPQRLALLAALYALAIVIGVGSAWLWLTRVGLSGVDAGAWRVNLLAGSRDADAYTRARIALGAVLALDRSETLYYTTDHDDSGAPLRADCRYRIEGTPPPARWWSLTAYADDHFLFANDAKRYSVNGETVRLDAAGNFSATIGPPTENSLSDTAWIPTAGRGGMRLTLRLYGAAEAVQRAPESLATPTIRLAGGCP